MHTEQVLFLSVPRTGAFAVFPRLPVPQFVAMTLTAQLERFTEIYKSAAGKSEIVALMGVVTVQTPAVLCVMFKHNTLVGLNNMLRAVDLVIGRVTFRTGEYPF